MAFTLKKLFRNDPLTEEKIQEIQRHAVGVVDHSFTYDPLIKNYNFLGDFSGTKMFRITGDTAEMRYQISPGDEIIGYNFEETYKNIRVRLVNSEEKSYRIETECNGVVNDTYKLIGAGGEIIPEEDYTFYREGDNITTIRMISDKTPLYLEDADITYLHYYFLKKSSNQIVFFRRCRLEIDNISGTDYATPIVI